MTPGTERSNQAFVEQAMRGRRFASVRWVAETGSTNTDLADAARRGEGEQVLIADLQTAGKGRRGRTWAAPTGSGLLMSLLIRNVDVANGFWAVAAVSLAACRAFDDLTRNDCSLKWPNDVMVDVAASEQRKIAGVLAEAVDGGVVVGIGSNVNWPEQVPSEMSERGTALNRHTSDRQDIDRAALAVAMLQGVEDALALDSGALRRQWAERCSTLGHDVRLDLHDRSVHGRAICVDESGALRVQVGDRIETHHVGDVVRLRR